MKDFGDIVFFSHEPGEYELAMESLNLKILEKKGFNVKNPLVRRATRNITLEEVEAVKQSHREAGAPENIARLFKANNKKKARKIIKNMKITAEELALIVLNADTLGFEHTRKHKEFIPEDIKTTTQEKSAFLQAPKGFIHSKDANKFVSKVKQLSKQRKWLSAHLFENVKDKNIWHILFFERREITQPRGQSHYKDGEHIHYISHLFGNQSKEKIWDALEEGEKISGSEHIKYVPMERKPDIIKGSIPGSKIVISTEVVKRLEFNNYKDPDFFSDPDTEEIGHI